MPTITPFLWFDTQAEEAMRFYLDIFKDGKELHVHRMGPNGPVQSVTFEILGQKFMGLNAGPMYSFTEAISFFVDCADQSEVDYYWEHLTADGGSEQPCGWLKDKFGISWQVIPKALGEYLGGDDMAGSKRALEAMLSMKKIDIATLERAYKGE